MLELEQVQRTRYPFLSGDNTEQLKGGAGW